MKSHPDFSLYLLDAISNQQLPPFIRITAISLMKQLIKTFDFANESNLKKLVEPTLSPILSSQDPILVNLVSSLIADIALEYGTDTFQNIESIIMTLLSDPSQISSALSLLNELLQKNYILNPVIIPMLSQYLISPLSCQILSTCRLFVNKFPSEVKQVIILPLFAHLNELPNDVMIEFIHVVIEILNYDVDQNLIAFLIPLINDPDYSKSIPAADYFENAENLPFIPEVVISLYKNLSNDEEIDADGISKQSINSLLHIGEQYPEELTSLLLPQISTDIKEMSKSASIKALRAITAIQGFVSDIEPICNTLLELLNSPLKKEVIPCLCSLTQSHQEFIAPIISTIFPLTIDEDPFIRMQALRSLMPMISEIELPCDPFKEFIVRMLQSPEKDELPCILEFIAIFFGSVDYLEGHEEIASLVSYMVNAYMTSSDDFINYYYFGVIAAAILKMPTSSETLLQTLSPKIIPQLDNFESDPDLCRITLQLMSNFFSINPTHQIFSVIVPKIAPLLVCSTSSLIIDSWAFASDLLRNAFQLFEPLIPIIIQYISNMDYQVSGILGNVALVLYDLFKLSQQLLISKDVCENLISVFGKALQEIDIDQLDADNISLVLLRLINMYPQKVVINPEILQVAIQNCVNLDEERLIEESKQLIGAYMSFHPELTSAQAPT
ncbi:hypothetical protein TRFO_04957 [Tritrichomonas foetus]|uniref:Importin N-terminal domain-containing protein n=1 Tax=Tritrichomonas foetus TaxID=1144522 RepID=A0A1J4KG60_9EUKA|nr:hypothetical protein TRFO_04957 [Tritrichomonas foetus]|eukprot:OHT08333.1 hypothetical protein TRFO_04957 [Tritrichomonas foetus]